MSADTAYCDCCGARVPFGAGFVINAELSQRFAGNRRLAADVREMMGSLGAAGGMIVRKQVLACSDNCAGRAVGSDEELAIARLAAGVWWAGRSLGEDIYVTKAMLRKAPTSAASAGLVLVVLCSIAFSLMSFPGLWILAWLSAWKELLGLSFLIVCAMVLGAVSVGRNVSTGLRQLLVEISVARQL